VALTRVAVVAAEAVVAVTLEVAVVAAEAAVVVVAEAVVVVAVDVDKSCRDNEILTAPNPNLI
jgi:hypothetical protein